MCTHLAKRGSVYYYRRKTPVELVHLFGKEVMKSLGTKDRKLAETLVRQFATEYDMLFAAASANLVLEPEPTSQADTQATPKAKESIGKGLTIDDSAIYAYRFLKRLREHREQAAQSGNYQDFQQRLDNTLADAKEYLVTGVHPFEDNPAPMWKLEAQIKAIKALRKNKDLPYIETYKSPASAAAMPPEQIGESLSQLVDKWAAERTPRLKTVSKMRTVAARLEKVTGAKPIEQISKRDVVAFKDELLASGSSAANTNQYLTELNVLLNFAKQQAIIETNPAQGVRVKVNESAKDKRLPFDLPALTAIFNSPIYTRGERPIGGKGEASYWLPLLALYTGARIEELCQLQAEDIKQERYQDDNDETREVWVISISDEGEDQKLKNLGSRRRIPVHNVLIDLGFIKYVQALNSSRLFPQLTPAKNYGTYSANWSKWFGNYLRKVIGITDTRMVFHSFRHCFKDYARAASISTEVHNALTGHSSGDVAEHYGSKHYPLQPLVLAMDKYKVSGLELTHVTKAQY
ncbi:DUF6538 domain-containing protein [Methylophilus sp. 'Pure River']|uniref:DUF6538 domain-containing protein n=1 Tax=Methylophilus sp. 'Pure River' TaxID=3377117 RepID=UPI00398F234C